MINLIITKIICDDIPNDLKSEAQKEGVSIAKDKKQVLFGAYTDGVLVGFCSFVLFNHGRYGLLKSAYVAKPYRRKGVYKTLNENRMQYAKSIGLPYVLASAYFEAAAHLIKTGGTIEKKYNEGYLIKINLQL